ncbi:DNA-binding XRE family transcriptional regulator [Arcicella aurantiaca]|uniref:DNA-binding XRE family transcriptional regulator n=1 Tax=Arcicella aurantiaca TaxID=591202 RepID=A0A316E690_9BACT|nr:helix-turn-helix transcriptional regulator [Arcicella aurantiaca]PWK25148.1 DNA-binding XRE family transcriptional regulator [Arcicella aurantiaca]
MSIVSNNIKYLRRLNGLTQEQFARRIGIKRSLLGAYEEARANPNLENLKTIAQVFGTSVDSLIKTDIRKIRETPGISLAQSTTGIMPQVASQSRMQAEPTPIERPFANTPEPQPVAKIVEDFFQEKVEVQVAPQRPIPQRSYLADNETSFQQFVDNHLHTFSNSAKVEVETPQKNGAKTIPYIKNSVVKEYLANCQRPEYLRGLPTLSLPFISSDKNRAFEMGSDFPMQNSIVVGSGIADWSDIHDGKFYVLVTTQQGVIYRRVYNQVKIKGALLLSSDNSNIPSFEISIKDVVEIWEVNSFISQQLPEPHISLERVKSLVDDLTIELDRLR